jgi:DNA-binding XRE family transcriptional regulator
MIKVRNAEAQAGYKLSVTFSDGTSGTADLAPYVGKRPLDALADERIFRHVLVEHGAVEWPDAQVGIATEALYAFAHGLPKPDTLEQVRENELRVSLRELRKVIGKTQVDVAEEAGLTQGALSHFENAPDHKLSALRKYVAALGGELEVAAVIGGRRFPLNGV